MKKSFLLSIVCGLFIASTTNAYAYLDPVMGSFILQGLIGGIVAAMVAIRSVRDRVLGFFHSKKPKATDRDDIDTAA